MKLPSLFRTPRHSRFSYEPRYYDPIKEEIEEKFKAARASKDGGNAPGYHSSISAAFRKREKKSRNASAIQLILAVAMMATFTAWLFYGNKVFYAFFILTPFYFYWRLKKQGSRG